MKKNLMPIMLLTSLIALATACTNPSEQLPDPSINPLIIDDGSNLDDPSGNTFLDETNYGEMSVDEYFASDSDTQSAIIDYACIEMGFETNSAERDAIIEMFVFSENSEETVDDIVSTYFIDEEVLEYPFLTAYYSFDYDYSSMSYDEFSRLFETEQLFLYLDFILQIGEDYTDKTLVENLALYIETQGESGIPLDEIIATVEADPSVIY